MKHIIAVGSKNKTKIKAVQEVFTSGQYDVVGYDVGSGVSDQPFSDAETKAGAIGRAKQSVQMDAFIGIGLEGGVEPMDDGLYLCNWGALVDQKGRVLTASGAKIGLPQEVADGLYNGYELKTVMDAYTNKHEVSHYEGAVGIFSNGLILREQMFSHVVRLLYGQWLFYQKHS
ncbi:inosine/xanthosine triphosphatase [Alteribacillus persepolensis]|uniref:inosine/xanthosine triphosphatase n=1 Tax=Alteribacillus persepolensis TaxID=568899 RepID=A0A1G8KG09_9BACI|nr:DUF84 family protein [Alteribacillus persepolensis]SDI42361.1 inosine/xanthosine triphosphatase [Alteribacillus persepolensis]